MVNVYIILDTCASMNQVIADGISYIDIAKASIEALIKYKFREVSTNGRFKERFILVIYDQISNRTIITKNKEGFDTFLSKLKLIRCYGTSKLDQCLKDTFHLINLTRLSSGIETFSFGRKPYYLDPTSIIIFTQLHTPLLRSTNNKLDINPIFDGFELYDEPFRWDTKIYVFCLLSRSQEKLEKDTYLTTHQTSLLAQMCEKTRGYLTYCNCVGKCVTEMNTVIDFAAKLSVGVDFIEIQPETCNKSLDEGIPLSSKESNIFVNLANPTLKSTIYRNKVLYRSLIHFPSNISSDSLMWPIPEPYILLTSMDKLPSRTSFPTIYFSPKHPITKIYTGYLNFDHYLIERDTLTEYLLNMYDQDVSFDCLMNHVNSNSIHEKKGFGYISLNHDEKCIHLHIGVHDYNSMIKLVDEAINIYKLKPSNEWKYSMEYYLESIPFYYLKSVKIQLKKLNLPHEFIRDKTDYNVGPAVANYINKIMNQAKEAVEKFHNETLDETQLYLPNSVGIKNESPSLPLIDCWRDINPRKILRDQKLPQTITSLMIKTLACDLFNVPVLDKKFITFENTTPFHNPFDVEISTLYNHLQKMRENSRNFFNDSQNMIMNEDRKHNIPISIMGDYQSRVKDVNPDKLLDPTAVRAITFGSPFKRRQPKEFSANESDIQTGTNNDNSRGLYYRVRMENRRRCFKLSLTDSTFSSAVSSPPNELICNQHDTMSIDLPQPLLNISAFKAWHLLQQKPFLDYLHECYAELRNQRPSLKIFKQNVEKLKSTTSVLHLFLDLVRCEALLFNNFKFISFAENELIKLNNIV